MSISFPKCNQAGIEFVISTNEELQEESKFLSEEFPIAMYTQNFNHAASDSIPFHWHDELQITWISDGELEYCISGDKFRLRSDKLLLLQSHQLHSSRTTTCDVKTLCINFTPEIFHPLILQKYIQPMLDSHAFAYSLLLLKPHQITKLKKFQNWKQEPLGYFSVMNFLSQVFEEILRKCRNAGPGGNTAVPRNAWIRSRQFCPAAFRKRHCGFRAPKQEPLHRPL